MPPPVATVLSALVNPGSHAPSTSPLLLTQQSSASSTPRLTFEDVLAQMPSSTALFMSPQPGWGADSVHWVDVPKVESNDGKWSATIEWETTGLFSFGMRTGRNSAG
jgi:hypothetical protein